MRDRFSGKQKLKFDTRFRRQYFTCGITPNSLNAISITHLDIHLKHTWKLAWVINEDRENLELYHMKKNAAETNY